MVSPRRFQPAGHLRFTGLAVKKDLAIYSSIQHTPTTAVFPCSVPVVPLLRDAWQILPKYLDSSLH